MIIALIQINKKYFNINNYHLKGWKNNKVSFLKTVKALGLNYSTNLKSNNCKKLFILF